MKSIAKAAPAMRIGNTPFAEIELLDPAAPTRFPANRHGERVLGLALLFAVALFAILQFCATLQLQGAYRQGLQAAAAQDWSAAQVAFQAASGYADAEDRAITARQLGAEVLLLARQAAAAERRCDRWALYAPVARLRTIATHSSTTARLERDLGTVQYWPTWCHATPTAQAPLQRGY